ncbi:hypothetical protein VP1G_08223 [Cytospora mali]|uniref:Ubiquitin-like domain-containing protein n=1 Tax=Cytospora mali TaxID=578113 RepID=A0A194VAP8_CYTMA|nr:hypothetical protein VP1G_08223 [Valsa mali var. pyri (nom. inval.)]
MDGPKDSGTTATPNEAATRTAAEDAAVNAPTDEVSPLGHEALTDLCKSKQISTSISDQDSAISDGNGSGDVPHVKEGPTAQVASPGSFQSSSDVQTPLTAKTHGEGLIEGTSLDHDVAVTKKDGSLSKLTEENGSSPPSSPSIKSGKNLYTSSEPLVDETRAKNNLRSYDADSEDTGDEQYRTKIDKGKGKEIASRVPDPRPVSPAEGQQGQSLNNVPWVQDPERPPQKFPIRFTDCVGRNFVWPWKKAKTWKGAKRLVESAFLYVDVLGPHVFAGHYDLTIQGMWSDPKTAAINPTLASYPPATTQPSNSIHSDNCIDGIGAASSAPSSSFQPGLPPPSTNLFPHLVPKVAGRGAIILPELWEDVVEPGMLILMRMWPIAPSPSTHSHPHHMPVVPMPPPFHSHHGVGTGRGRGRGAGTATAGRGSTQQPPPQPGWQQPARRRGPPLVVLPLRPPKGKTRKRQDGL